MKAILVTGTHRSGTTWVGRMLAVQRRVFYLHEPFNVDHVAPRYGLPLRHWFAYTRDLPDEETFLSQYKDVIALRARPDAQVPASARASNAGRRWQIRARSLAKKLITRAVVVKDPIALLSAGRLAARFNMQVVCMIRHPLAFCSSLKRWNWKFPFDHFLAQPALMAEFFPDFRAQVEEFARRPRPIVDQAILLWNMFHHVIRHYQEVHPDWIFLRHEDVARDPMGSFERIYSTLGLPFTRRCREAIVESGSSKESEAGTFLFRARDHRRILETWKERLEQDEVERILSGTTELRHYFYSEG